MTRDEIATRARKVVVDHFNATGHRTVDGETITDDTAFMGSVLGGDSLDCVEVVMELEDEFNIEINDEVAAGLETFGQAVDHLASELAAT